MKQKTLLAFMIIILAVARVLAQSEVEYDFQSRRVKFIKGSKGKDERFLTSHYKGHIHLLVKDINLNRYEVQIETNGTTYDYAAEENSTATGVKSKDQDGTPKKGLELDLGDVEAKFFGSEKMELTSMLDALRAADFTYLVEDAQSLLSADIAFADAMQWKATFLESLNESGFMEFKHLLTTATNSFNYEVLNSEKNLDYTPTKSMEKILENARQQIDQLSPLIRKVSALGRKDYYAPFTITSIEDDEVEVVIKIKEKAAGSNPERSLPDASFLVRTHGKWKINFSTGAIFNIGLSDESYEIVDDKIQKQNRDDAVWPVFPTALAHFYRQSTGFTNWGGTFGLGLSDNGKASYYLGLSLILGEQQRIIIGGGAALRKVQGLKSRYSEGQEFEAGTAPTQSELTDDPYKFGGFFSLTYNLSSIKK